MCFEPLSTAAEVGGIDRLGSAPTEPQVDAGTANTPTDPVLSSDDGPSRTNLPEVGRAEPVRGSATWTCRTCETVNPMADDVCAVCGTTIFETMGAETDEITLTREQGLRMGLIPGWAHARLGEPLLGLMIAILVAACVVFAIVFIQSGGAVWGLVVGLVGLLTWGVSLFDVNQRIAGAAPILKPRVMTILGGVVIVVIMVAGFVAGATAVRSPGS